MAMRGGDKQSEIDLNSIVKVSCNFEMLKKIIEMLISGQKELKTQLESVEDTITNMPQLIASSTHKSSGYIHPSEDSDLFESDDYDDIMNKVIKRIAKIKKRLTHLEEHNQQNEKKFFDVQIELKHQQNEMERYKKDINGIINKQSELDDNESVMRLIKEMEMTYQQKFANVDERIKNIEKVYQCGSVVDNNNNNSNSDERSMNMNNRMEENQTQTEQHIHMHDTINQNNINNIINNDIYNSLHKQISTLSTDIQNLKLHHNNKSSLFERNIKDLQTSFQTSLSQIKPSLEQIPLLLPISAFTKFHDTITFNHDNAVRDIKLELSLQKKSLNNFKEQLTTILSDTAIHDELQGMKRRLEAFMTQLHVLHDTSKKFEEQLSSKPQFDPTKYIDVTQFNEFKQTLSKQFSSTTTHVESVNSIVDDLISNVMKHKATFKDLKNLEDTVLLKVDEMRNVIAKTFAEKNEVNRHVKYLETQIKHVMDYAMNARGKANANVNDTNWLIAKKPINGHLCASCEAYIGELNNSSTSYVPWNKIPNKDTGDKLYRMGTGFSKMLQMVNVDQNSNNSINTTILVSPRNATTDRKNNDNIQGCDDNNNNNNNNNINQYASTLKESHSLPHIKFKRKMNATTCDGFYGKDEVVGMHMEDDDNEERSKPKITKVIKKQK